MAAGTGGPLLAVGPPRPGGAFVRIDLEEERKVPASPERLAWRIRNAERFAPLDGRRWKAYDRRLSGDPRAREEALRKLDRGIPNGIPKRFVLEGKSHADCIVECERAILRIEGKRFD